MPGTRLAIALSFVAGLSGAAQASFSGLLGRRIGTLQAAGFGAMLGALLIVGLAVVLGRGAGILAALHEPAWLWLVGLFGATIVISITYAPPIIGTFATVALLIAGQLVAGVLIDALGLLGSPRIPMTITRIGGLVLLVAGAALTLKR